MKFCLFPKYLCIISKPRYFQNSRPFKRRTFCINIEILRNESGCQQFTAKAQLVNSIYNVVCNMCDKDTVECRVCNISGFWLALTHIFQVYVRCSITPVAILFVRFFCDGKLHFFSFLSSSTILKHDNQEEDGEVSRDKPNWFSGWTSV